MTELFLRRACWVGVAACLVIGGFGLTVCLLGPASGVTAVNARRVTEGMTLDEVEAVLGPGKPAQIEGADAWWWRDGKFLNVFVYFANGRVTEEPWVFELEPWGGRPEPEPPLGQRFRSVLGF
jgi:hypothetical protein